MGKRVAWYLRDARNLHYFAAMRPYLERFDQCAPRYVNRLVVSSATTMMEHIDYQDFAHLFTVGEALEDFDLVVTPTWLRPDEHPVSTPAVQIFHGISDKPFTVERDFSRYALVLCIGQRQVDRLHVYPQNWNIVYELVGYAKLDTPPEPLSPFHESRRPVIVYAPTWAKGGFSSIHRFLAPGVVDSLVEHFDLAIKPHPNIFNPDRPHYDRHVVEQLARLENHDSIAVVRAGNVLPYFAAADLCIADISSAGYEWLWFDKPIVFLNPDPQRFSASQDIQAPTFLWQGGEVCNDPLDLVDIVLGVLECDRHAAVREQLLSYSIHLPYSGNAAVHGAEAIRRVLHG